MKTSISSIAKIAGGLALMAASSVAMASVVDTAHNLGASGTHNNNSATTEICIFCHTPHGGDQATDAPIWNRGTNTNTYTRFSSLGRLTFDAKEAPIGSVSAACLSCHDGTQAMDAVINSQGSNTVSTVGNGWVEAQFMSTMAAADGHYYNDGSESGRGDMVYLGTDLSNDHPISMSYGGGGISTTATNGTTTDPDFAQAIGAAKFGGGVVSTGNPGGLFNIDGTTRTGDTSNAGVGTTVADNQAMTIATGTGTGAIAYNGNGAAPRWWVDTTNDATANYTSKDFPLYTRLDVSGGVATGEPTVECGTCHDPHSGNSTFLRLVGGNQGSQVCLTCHAK